MNKENMNSSSMTIDVLKNIWVSRNKGKNLLPNYNLGKSLDSDFAYNLFKSLQENPVAKPNDLNIQNNNEIEIKKTKDAKKFIYNLKMQK